MGSNTPLLLSVDRQRDTEILLVHHQRGFKNKPIDDFTFVPAVRGKPMESSEPVIWLTLWKAAAEPVVRARMVAENFMVIAF